MIQAPRFLAHISLLAALGGLTAVAALTGCTSTPLANSNNANNTHNANISSDASTPVPISVLGQNALPPGAKLRAEQSLIMGAGDQWVGRVVADVGRDIDLAYRFFIDAYPAQGWTLISSVRGKTSLIVLTKQDRTATIELLEPTVVATGSAVLTVSPRNAAVVAPRKL